MYKVTYMCAFTEPPLTLPRKAAQLQDAKPDPVQVLKPGFLSGTEWWCPQPERFTS